MFVYVVGSLGRGGTTPLKLALADAATSAALSSLVSAVVLPRNDIAGGVRSWLVGGAGGGSYDSIRQVLAFLVVGFVVCLLSARGLNSLALGDELAAGLGERVALTRGSAAVGAVVLCGASVAVTGPIGFVGLVVPHACRLLVGVDHRWLLPFSAGVGAVLLTGADVLGRVVAGFCVTLVVGQTTYPPADVLRVVLGQEVQGASFTVGRLRLPRAVLAVSVGLCFGLAGVTFQTMLRNPLASPDVIGISSGASAAAAFAIVVLQLGPTAVSVVAIVAGLTVALVVYALSSRGGVAGTRLILVGIGIAAMLDSVTAYVLSQAAEWDLQEAMRWLTGSLNGARWEQVVPVVVALAVLGPVLLLQTRDLAATQLGDDTASALGVRVGRTCLLLVLTAVGLVCFATAAAGPVAFVAFLAGPIAARLVGPGRSLLVPAALVGAVLVLVGDFAGQFLLGTRYPVGVVTGVLGAPYLVYLIVRTNRAGGSL